MASVVTVQENETESGWGLEQTAGLLLFGAVLLFYGLKAPEFAVPGRWAGMLSSFFGLEPSRMPVRPLWSGLMGLAAQLPAGQAAHLVNLLSALIGATVSLLLFTIVRRIPFFTGQAVSRWAVERRPRLLAGLFAGLMGAVSYPIMTVATQGDFFILDALLLLLPLWPATLYLHRPQRGLVLASFLAFGLGLAEYPTMAMLLPGFFLWWLWQLWRNMQLRSMLVPLAVLLLFLVAAVVMLVFASFIRGHLGAAGGTPASLLTAWQLYLKLYGLELLRSVPKVGWLLLIGTNLLPLVFVVFRPLDEPEDLFNRIGVYSFRVILFVLGVVTLFELPGSPGRLLGFQIMVVAPYVIAAIWFGHLLGYFYGLATRKPALWPRRAWVALWLAVMLGAGVWNHRATQVGLLQPVVQFADEVVAGLEGRTVLITDGTLDASLRLAARQAKVPLYLVNVRNEDPAHTAQLAARLPDANLKSAAYLGVTALLREWMNQPESLVREVALLTAPHVVPAGGLTVIPWGAVYALARPEAGPTDDALRARHQAAWSRWPAVKLDALKKGDPGWFQLQFIQRWSSRLANDLGVWLDDRGQAESARAAYEQALIFWDDNLSATFNLLAQAQKDKDAEQETELTARIKLQAERNPEGLNPAFMRRVSGLVRNPMLNFESGTQLVRAGLRADAMAEAERMAGLLGGEEPNAQVELARLFMRGNRLDQAEKLLRDVVQAAPDHLGAHVGLLNLALLRRDLNEAEQQLIRLQELGVPEDRLAVERAGLDMMLGKTEEARRRYLELVKKPAPPAEAWFALARLASQAKDPKLFDEALVALKKERGYLPGQLLLAEHALQQRNVEEGRRLLERVVAMDPANLSALGRLAQLDFDRRDAAALRQRVAAILSADPENALGHFFAANVHIAASRYDLAEASLRKSLARQEYDQALNDLAWILQQRGESEEALKLSRRSLELNNKNYSFWDTLAAIHHKRGDRDETLAALDQALKLSERKDAGLLLHAATIYLERGEINQAQACLSELEKAADRLPPALAKQLEALKTRAAR